MSMVGDWVSDLVVVMSLWRLSGTTVYFESCRYQKALGVRWWILMGGVTPLSPGAPSAKITACSLPLPPSTSKKFERSGIRTLSFCQHIRTTMMKATDFYHEVAH